MPPTLISWSFPSGPTEISTEYSYPNSLRTVWLVSPIWSPTSYRVNIGPKRAFSVCSALLIGFVAERFLALWVGPINYGGPVLVVVTAATLVVGSLFRWSAAVLSAALDVKSIALVRLVEGVLNLGLSISFVKMGLGLVGLLMAMWAKLRGRPKRQAIPFQPISDRCGSGLI